jgi:hypothetical protein
MLDTVLLARDKYLVEGGLMFPDQATMYLAGIEDADYREEKIGCEHHSAKTSTLTMTLKLIEPCKCGSLVRCVWLRLLMHPRNCPQGAFG